MWNDGRNTIINDISEHELMNSSHAQLRLKTVYFRDFPGSDARVLVRG